MPSSMLLLAKNCQRARDVHAGPREVTSLYKAIDVCATPKSMAFVPFHSKKGSTLCPFWPQIEFSFQGN